MSIVEVFQQFIQKYIEIATNFFAWYDSVGRNVLDVLHSFFDNLFNVLLFIAVLVSILYLIMSLYTIFRKNRQKKEEKYDGELPFVTVQIPTFNELAAIRCAESCLNFDYPQDKYEIIIGDDSNKPEISKKITEFARGNPHIKIVRRGSNLGYKPGNLNNMLKHSRGEILVIFDSDFIPREDFITRIVKPFINDRKVAGVQARWKLINANQNMISALGATIVWTHHYITMPFMYNRRSVTFLCGSAEAVRKDVLVQLGGWESGNLTEDIEFSLRLLENGYKIQYLSDLECDSEVPYTIKDLYRQQMRWAYGVIYSWKNHFKSLAKSKHLSFADNLYMQGIFLSGYLLSVLLAGLFVVGALSLITHAPEPIKWGELFFKLGRNILLTSGLLFASYIALLKARKAKLVLPMIASSFSYGLIVTYYVNIGIFKALAKTPMEWYMLNKHGNKIPNS